jgi:hypothetical protein
MLKIKLAIVFLAILTISNGKPEIRLIGASMDEAIAAVDSCYKRDKSIIDWRLRLSVTSKSPDGMSFSVYERALKLASRRLGGDNLVTLNIDSSRLNYLQAMKLLLDRLDYKPEIINERIVACSDVCIVVTKLTAQQLHAWKSYVHRIHFGGADISAETIRRLEDSLIEIDGASYFLEELGDFPSMLAEAELQNQERVEGVKP